jgi:Holliday junction resolvase RusA-like endonuclease
MNQEIKLILPFPPSVNGLYSGKARRFKSKKYQAWIVEARMALLRQEWEPLTKTDAPLQVIYNVGNPDKRRRDLSNLEKAASDLLVSEGIISDDSLIHKLIMEWKNNVKGMEVTISYYDKTN